MSSITQLSEALAKDMEKKNYRWKIGGRLQVPTAEDVEKVLTHAKEVVDKDESPTVQLEIGRLIVRKALGMTDVYLHYGEIND